LKAPFKDPKMPLKTLKRPSRCGSCFKMLHFLFQRLQGPFNGFSKAFVIVIVICYCYLFFKALQAGFKAFGSRLDLHMTSYLGQGLIKSVQALAIHLLT
jgi:hypothetical protein